MSLLRSPLCFISQSSQEQENKIYTEGCVDAGDKWLSSNLVPVAGALVAVALVQVCVQSSPIIRSHLLLAAAMFVISRRYRLNAIYCKTQSLRYVHQFCLCFKLSLIEY